MKRQGCSGRFFSIGNALIAASALVLSACGKPEGSTAQAPDGSSLALNSARLGVLTTGEGGFISPTPTLNTSGDGGVIAATPTATPTPTLTPTVATTPTSTPAPTVASSSTTSSTSGTTTTGGSTTTTSGSTTTSGGSTTTTSGSTTGGTTVSTTGDGGSIPTSSTSTSTSGDGGSISTSGTTTTTSTSGVVSTTTSGGTSTTSGSTNGTSSTSGTTSSSTTTSGGGTTGGTMVSTTGDGGNLSSGSTSTSGDGGGIASSTSGGASGNSTGGSSSGGGQCQYPIEPVTSTVLLLEPSDQSLSIHGNGSLEITGALVIDSSNLSAAVGTGNALVQASTLDIVGNYRTTGNAAFHIDSVAQLASAAADPLRYLPVPDVSAMPVRSTSALHLSKGNILLLPGVYVGGVSIDGKANVTMAPGIYVIEGAIQMAGQSALQGDGVMMYVQAGVHFSGPQTTVALTPPTDGTYRGVSIFQARASSASIDLTGQESWNLLGMIYAANAPIRLSGNGSLHMGSRYISRTLTVIGNGSMSIAGDGPTPEGCPQP